MTPTKENEMAEASDSDNGSLADASRGLGERDGNLPKFTPGLHKVAQGQGWLDAYWAVKGPGGDFLAQYCSRPDAHLFASAHAMYAALAALVPTNINVNHPALRDDQTVPCDVTIGELRAACAALALARGVSQ